MIINWSKLLISVAVKEKCVINDKIGVVDDIIDENILLKYFKSRELLLFLTLLK
jgi:hypothetical protein